MPCRVYDSVPVLYDTSPNQTLLFFLEWFLGEQSGVLMTDLRRAQIGAPSDSIGTLSRIQTYNKLGLRICITSVQAD